MAIRSFRNGVTKDIFDGFGAKGFSNAIVKAARRKLNMIDAAAILSDLRVPPGNHLHALERERSGQHAVRVNDQYRICFRWTIDGPEDVELTDYH